MGGTVTTEQGRYRAFISYSHGDSDAASRLHRRLEAYRMPRRLVGRVTDLGPVPARLLPIFRDREELPAAADLTASVRAALAGSEALIVLCSPHAANSSWVNREIEFFRRNQTDRPVLAALVAGEPPTSFPLALKFVNERDSEIEPLAADLRPEGDEARFGLLKLVAGLTGLELDELLRRDAQRRVRRVTAVTALAGLAMLIMATLTVFALRAQAEAERQRTEAEGLIEFMLTDLRDQLKGVGRLDVLTSANRRALAYYSAQPRLDRLSPDSLERRARALHAMGEDDLARGRLDAAAATLREAHRTTAALLESGPSASARVFAHAQSEFWLGYLHYRREAHPEARAAFQRYRDLAGQLLAADGDNPDWLREAAYAEGNLCSVALAPPVDARSALRSCAAALQLMTRVARLRPGDRTIAEDLVNRHAWLADAWNLHGRWDRVLHHRVRQEELARALLASDPRNSDYQDIWARTQLTFGELLLEHGEAVAARQRLAAAASTLARLRARDPENADWRSLEQRLGAVGVSLGQGEPR